MRPWTILAVVLALGLLLAGCNDEDVAETREDIEDATGEAGARALGEELRAALKAKELGVDENLRDVATLQDAVDDLPGDPEVTGIEDADGDGRDDDGQVEVRTGDQAACVTVSEDGENVDVEGGACA